MEEKEYLTIVFRAKLLLAAMQDAMNFAIDIGQMNVHGLVAEPISDGSGWAVNVVYVLPK